MRAVVLTDNISACGMDGEWGLCIYIEYGDKKVLLDTGKSDLFLKNADKLGVSLKKIDYAVLSHAHYDHADGMRAFFGHNGDTEFYIQKCCGENCYKREGFKYKYIGISKGLLSDYRSRIKYVSGDLKLSDGIYIVAHKTPGLEALGKREKMYVRNGLWFKTDDFSHEQSLVFDTDKGLVVFNSCSHGGADNIINEITETFPDKKVYALIGGFHLYNKTEKEVRGFAGRVKETGVSLLYTGHCTGDNSYKLLKEELGDCVNQFKVGLEIII